MKGGTVDAHEERITSLLALKAHEAGYDSGASYTRYTPLSALLESEEDSTIEAAMRGEILGGFIDFVLQDGPHPADCMKNFYAVVHALRPKAMKGRKWTCADFGMLFGESKAAHSWRVKQLFSVRMEAKGLKAVQAPFQKSAESIPKYAAAQKGNSNRRHGLPRPEQRKAA